MIIECPSCHTKFFVDTSQLEDVENPRFHCSRCDHFFELSESLGAQCQGTESINRLSSAGSSENLEEWGNKDGKPVEEAPAKSTDKESQTEEPKFEVSETSQRQFTDSEIAPALDSSQYDYDEAGAPSSAKQLDLLSGERLSKKTVKVDRRKLQHAFVEGEEMPLVTADWPDGGDASEREADYRALRERHPNQYVQERPLAPPWPAEDLEELEAVSRGALSATDEPAALEKKDFSTPIGGREEDAEPSEPLSEDRLWESQGSAWDENSEFRRTAAKVGRRDTQRLKQELEVPDTEVQDVMTGDSSYMTQIQGHPWRSLLAIAAPPLLCTLALGLWSWGFIGTPEIVKSLLLPRSNELPRVTPPGLELVDLRSRVITLDDGKQVIEVVGQLLNATSHTFEEISLEAALFDESNRRIASLTADADNGLIGAKISTFHVEDLRTLQRKSNSVKSHLKPNEKSPVRLVFTDKTEDARWFSTRVRSVRSST